MPSPFPGMDPYLEHPGLWPGFHNWLIAALADDLSGQLSPAYVVALEQRVYVAESPDLVGRPDAVVIAAPRGAATHGASAAAPRPMQNTGTLVLEAILPLPDEIHESYLEVRDAVTGDVVTLIEVLSPANKLAGRGRREYEQKRWETLRTRTNLVEIDLLGAGERLPVYLRDWPAGAPPPGDYRIVVARGWQRPRAEMYAFSLRDAIPDVPVPLKPEDDEPALHLGRVAHGVYDRGRYRQRIDYGAEPVPALTDDAAAWAAALLREASLR